MKPILIPSPEGETRLFVVLGDPVAQVQAPLLMNKLFSETGVDAVMVPIHVRPESLAVVMRGLKRIANLDGMLVTVPHKFAVCSHVDRVSATVELFGAANALRREPDGSWFGENFDGVGFVAGLRESGNDPQGKCIALIGAGGAGSAIAAALVEAGVAQLTVTDISPEKARHVAERLNAIKPGTVSDAAAPAVRDADVVVNCTPLGLRQEDPLPFELDELRPDALVAEIIMKPPKTRLLEAAEQRGLQIHAGIHMLTPQIALYGGFFGMAPGKLTSARLVD